MKRAHLAVAWTICSVAVVFLSGCSSVPYVDSRREAGKKDPVGASRPTFVAICYSPHAVEQADVQKLADSECAKIGRTAKKDHEDDWNCTLVSPTRAYYSCVAKP